MEGRKLLWLRVTLIVSFIISVIFICYSLLVSGLSSANEHSLISNEEMIDSSYTEQSKKRMTFATQRLNKQILEAKEKAITLQTQVMSIQRNASLNEYQKRTLISEFSKSILHSSLMILGVYTTFEKNALGDDALFINNSEKLGNEVGRYSLYYSLADDGSTYVDLVPEYLIKMDKMSKLGNPRNSWYTCLFENQGTCFIEPYYGTVQSKDNLIFSFSMPIIEKDNPIGVVGVDIAISSVTGTLNLIKDITFDSNARITLVNPDGLIVADTENNNVYGHTLEDKFKSDDNYRKLLNLKSPGSIRNADGSILYYSPILDMGIPIFCVFALVEKKDTRRAGGIKKEHENFSINFSFFYILEALMVLALFLIQYSVYRHFFPKTKK